VLDNVYCSADNGQMAHSERSGASLSIGAIVPIPVDIINTIIPN